ncbi:Receptor-like protein kinase HSL1 [Camellia lanceoleosa]|uniref:Receptor-like protein kinase HSL1 n=1 Tax=Camellia lanceoleosa TaxID=1840588 RepID=A0ACC0IGX4_9ERIC|nr:Receptor-like protein kinase HSL1 [Camellia lanceoleosa]
MSKIPLSILFLLFLIFPFHGTSQTTTSNSEQSILLKLKQYWSDPTPINHWNSTSTHCDWPEITCTNGSVTGLSLVDTNITGTVPPFICDLQNLTLIDLQYNYFSGPFPTGLYNCSKLKILDLSQNNFTGSIPSEIDRLSAQLQSLNLSGNNFTGDIPAAIGNFPELRILRVFLNGLNGSFPSEIGNLLNLEVLEMSFNNFSQMAIPSSFTQLKKLKELQMIESGLVGEIPETIGNLTALEVLALSKNSLTGNIPRGLFLLNNLTILYLYRNQLSGPIPQVVEALNLVEIDLSQNNLNGTIPDDFGKLTKLSVLDLIFNQLSGELPASIGRLPSLEVIKLFSNNLSGALPPDLGKYSMLKEFQVASNHFTGNLPEYLCANGALIGVIAFDNDLTGELPNSLGNCSSLLTVRVNGNRLFGSIPSGLWTSINVTTLILSDNLFSGQIPDQLDSNLSRIEISNNMFSGEIPAGVSSLKALTVFNASNNRFTGTIPQGLTALPHLTTLLLDGNQLSGHLPLDIISWNWLNTLHLSRNQLSGPIPAKIGSLPSLTDLDLSRNEFSGQIPPQIGLLKLTSLNLSSNLLTGTIPVEFENKAYDNSFLNNSGLCATNPSLLGIHVCSSGPQNSSKISPQFLAVIVSTAAALFALAMFFMFLLVKTYRKRECGLDSKWEFTQFQSLNFSESDILSSLTESNMIGSGGSGKVYRVVLNRLGRVVAVKKTQNIIKLDDKVEKEFLAEVQILGTIRHSNIVKLLCCISSETTKLLVYEYMENHSLDWWLHGKNRRLDWPKRLQIAVGTARGLCYMHHECSPAVIHRDVKSSNILLDSSFNAKVADFGLAKMVVKPGETNTMSVVAGSVGYLAPEYAHTRRVNEKIDVYSFGVVLLELVTGREANNNGDEDICLAEWAWRHVQDGNPLVDALDKEVKEPCYLDEMTCVFKLGIICTGTFPSTRPNMKEVLQILLGCCSHRPELGEKIDGSENAGAPLLKNSRRERLLDYEDDSLVSKV